MELSFGVSGAGSAGASGTAAAAVPVMVGASCKAAGAAVSAGRKGTSWSATGSGSAAEACGSDEAGLETRGRARTAAAVAPDAAVTEVGLTVKKLTALDSGSVCPGPAGVTAAGAGGGTACNDALVAQVRGSGRPV